MARRRRRVWGFLFLFEDFLLVFMGIGVLAAMLSRLAASFRFPSSPHGHARPKGCP